MHALEGEVGTNALPGPSLDSSCHEVRSLHHMISVIISCTDTVPDQEAPTAVSCELWSHKPKTTLSSIKMFISGNLSQ